MPATCDALLARCRAERVEPPGPSRIEGVLGTARASSEQRFTALITSRRRSSASSTGQTCVLIALREAIRRREVYVVGARR